MRLSVVVPCFNEAAVIDLSASRLLAVLGALPDVVPEVLFVDDGSRDGTLDRLRALAARHPEVRVVSFSRNFGHQFALTAGLDHADGDAVVVIDADLQDPPEVIPRLLAAWRDGYDVAYGVRLRREGETWFKRATAHLFYRLMRQLSTQDLPVDAGDFRLMDRAVVAALRALPERDRFMRGLTTWVGFRQVAVPYERHARAAGDTKYPFRKMARFALDGLLSFSAVPLRLATYFGFVVSLLSLVGIVYALYIRLFTALAVPGWAAQWITTMFLGGVQLISLGIIGEYIARIYGEVKSRPLYLVRERIGFGDPT